MNDTPYIVVVDDEAEIRELVADYLEPEGLQVSTAASGRELRQLLEQRVPDLVVLDLRMPGEDGFTLARHVRERHDIGIIMLTASVDVVDRVAGLEVGADDYIAKPFEPRELLVRIQAVLRRRRPALVEAGANPQVLHLGSLRYALADGSLTDDSGSPVHLSPLERELLATLVAHRGRVLSREELMDLSPSSGDESFDRSIDNRIKRLRRRIERNPEKPELIKTVRGSGYKLVADAS
jgi:DNA-binding response OmpR family regulator